MIQEGYIFVIKERGSRHYKIDITMEGIDDTFEELQLEYAHELLPVFEKRTFNPFKLMQELNNIYDNKRIRGKWFKLKDEDILDIGKFLVTERIRVASRKKEKAQKKLEQLIEKSYSFYKLEYASILTEKYCEKNYVEKGLSVTQIARNIGCRAEVVRELLEDLGFRIKTKYRLKDGRVFVLTENEVIKRDEGVCQICETDSMFTGKGIHVHYIDYNPSNNINHNMVTVCEGCLRRINAKKNRDYWRWYFTKRRKL